MVSFSYKFKHFSIIYCSHISYQSEKNADVPLIHLSPLLLTLRFQQQPQQLYKYFKFRLFFRTQPLNPSQDNFLSLRKQITWLVLYAYSNNLQKIHYFNKTETIFTNFTVCLKNINQYQNLSNLKHTFFLNNSLRPLGKVVKYSIDKVLGTSYTVDVNRIPFMQTVSILYRTQINSRTNYNYRINSGNKCCTNILNKLIHCVTK